MIYNIDKNKVSVSRLEDAHSEDSIYWARASLEEKLEMINYLRECFYGDEATTGRLQRFFEFSKQKTKFNRRKNAIKIESCERILRSLLRG